MDVIEKHAKTVRSISSPPGITPFSDLSLNTCKTSTGKSLQVTDGSSQKENKRRHTSFQISGNTFLLDPALTFITTGTHEASGKTLHHKSSSDGGTTPKQGEKIHESTSVFSFGGHSKTEDLAMTPRYSEVSSTPSTSPKDDNMASSKLSPTSKLDKRESYKAQRKNYRREKKRVAKELSSTLKDPSIIVLADWLKVRGTLKGWTKLWCVLRPGLLLLYKSPKTHKSSQWVGTLLLNACELIERPSKKDGFCFKLYHPLEQSIWASKGPKGETIGALVQPLPVTHLIFRAPSEAAGRCWMDALELALRCSSLLMRTMSHKEVRPTFLQGVSPDSISHEQLPLWNESDPEKHFEDQDWKVRFSQLFRTFSSSSSLSLSPRRKIKASAAVPRSSISEHRLNAPLETLDLSMSQQDNLMLSTVWQPFSAPNSPFRLSAGQKHLSCELWPKRGSYPEDNALLTPSSCNNTTAVTPSSSIPPDLGDDAQTDDNREIEIDHEGIQSTHSTDSESEARPIEEADDDIVETPYVENGLEEFGLAGDAGQTEEVADENKSLIWSLLKQVRPGMDLSKVVLPTFILEPRSFLDKLSDYYYHADILSDAVQDDDPLTRMKHVVKFYLSGFYKKPKGLKKPYNPILGEMFRCYWKHGETNSRTFYISEQVSHHPPVSAFYVTNRQDGFCIRGCILAKSKFYGNSISAIMDGTAHITLLSRGEDYTITMPYAHCKGILMGTLSLELGGKIDICCEKTGYRTELEFKLKPFLGGSELCNIVSGKIKLGKETMATFEGHWDGEIYIRDRKSGEDQLFWNPNNEVRSTRLKRHTVPIEYQEEFESEKLWQHVSCAIIKGDQIAATEEKTILEEAQRKAAREREVKLDKWIPRHFVQDIVTGEWVYRHTDSRPWDPRTDVLQYERDFKIQTQTRHRAPAVRTGSIVSIDDTPKVDLIRHLSVDRAIPRSTPCLMPKHRHRSMNSQGSESSSAGVENLHGSDSTESDDPVKSYHSTKCSVVQSSLQQIVERMHECQLENSQILKSLQRNLESLMAQQQRMQVQLANRGDMTLFIILIAVQIILHYFL